MPTAIDLFCGAGGFTLGLEQANIDVLCGIDNDPTAIETYRRNFSHPGIFADAAALSAEDIYRQINTTRIDIVVGGPPCQGFSIQRIGHDADPRNNLVLEFARLVAEIRPIVFLMENVPGLIGQRGKKLASAFEQLLTESGYATERHAINAAEYGVPQTRRRLVFVGWKVEGRPFDFPVRAPELRAPMTVREALNGLPSPPTDFSPDPSDPLHRRTRLSELNQRRIALVPPGGGMQDLPKELRVNCHKRGADRIGHRYVYGRLPLDEPAPTITARFDSFTRGRFGHPIEPRNMTLREGARLQSFPDTFEFAGSQEQIASLIGNAVPPLVARRLGDALIDYFVILHSRNGDEHSSSGRTQQLPLLIDRPDV